MKLNNTLLRERKVFQPKDFAFVTNVLSFLRSYELDQKAQLVGSAFTNYMIKQNQNILLYSIKRLFNPKVGRYNDIDILVRWDIYSDNDANRCIDDMLVGRYSPLWDVEPSDSREFLSGYGGAEKILNKFKISSKANPNKISTIDLIFEGERSFMDENESARRGNPLKPLK